MVEKGLVLEFRTIPNCWLEQHDDHGAHAVSASDGWASEKADRGGKYYFLCCAAPRRRRREYAAPLPPSCAVVAVCFCCCKSSIDKSSCISGPALHSGRKGFVKSLILQAWTRKEPIFKKPFLSCHGWNSNFTCWQDEKKETFKLGTS